MFFGGPWAGGPTSCGSVAWGLVGRVARWLEDCGLGGLWSAGPVGWGPLVLARGLGVPALEGLLVGDPCAGGRGLGHVGWGPVSRGNPWAGEPWAGRPVGWGLGAVG